MKIKKYILTETGEVREPKRGEYYIGYDKTIFQATTDGIVKYPILFLEEIFDDWKPKENELIFFICYKNSKPYIDSTFYNSNSYDERKLEQNNCFPNEESAIIKLNEVLNLNIKPFSFIDFLIENGFEKTEEYPSPHSIKITSYKKGWLIISTAFSCKFAVYRTHYKQYQMEIIPLMRDFIWNYPQSFSEGKTLLKFLNMEKK